MVGRELDAVGEMERGREVEESGGWEDTGGELGLTRGWGCWGASLWGWGCWEATL